MRTQNNLHIQKVHGREILDSRGNPTVQVEVTLAGDHKGVACVPSGASTGSLEALELRDGDKNRYLGKGVQQAVVHVNHEIGELVHGMDAEDQRGIDQVMIDHDGTANKSRLGANSILGVSLAVAHAASKAKKMPLYRHLGELYGNKDYSLPVPQMNIINGGEHADNAIDFQEFMILPTGADTFAEGVRCGAEIFHTLKGVLNSRNLATSVGDEGGFAPECASNEEGLALIMQAIQLAGYDAGTDVMIGLDAASTEFHCDGKYHLSAEKLSMDSTEFVDYLENWVNKYPIISIEDGMAEQDWDGWDLLTQRIGRQVQLTGDDLFVTNTEIFAKGIERGVANSILIKLNQIGSLSETMNAIRMAQEAGYCATISHRSGETEDTTIADLAVATAAGQIKTGSLCRSERIAKYNRLLTIAEELGENGVYPGLAAFSNLA